MRQYDLTLIGSTVKMLWYKYWGVNKVPKDPMLCLVTFPVYPV